MKKTMKKAVILFTATTMSASMLTGCSLVKTPKSILSKCAQNMQKAENIDLDVNMAFNVEIEKDGTKLTMGIDTDKDLFYERGEDEAFKIYLESSFLINMLGASQESKSEGYVVGDKDTITQYQKAKDEEQWSKSEKDKKDEVSYAFDFTELADKMTLAKETVTERDTECYVLEGDVTCKDIDFLFDDLGMDSDGMEDIEGTLTIKVAKKEQLPLSISLAIDDDNFEELIQDENLEEAGVSLAVTDFEFEVGLDGINLDKEIELPEETEDAVEKEAQDEGMFDFLDSTKDGSSDSSDDLDDIVTEEDDSENEVEEEEAKEEDTFDDTSDDEESLETDGSDYQIDAEGESLSKIDGITYKEYVNQNTNTSFLELTNEENEDKSICIYASFKKDGKVVDTNLSVLELEKDSYQVADFSSDEAFDEVEYTYEEYSTDGFEYLGKDMEVSYEMNEDVVTGSVTNKTGKDAEFVQVHIVLFNEDGEVIEHQYSYVDDEVVADGGSSSYDGYIDNKDYAEAKVYVAARAAD